MELLSRCLSARSRVVALFAVSCVFILTTGTAYSLSAWSPQLKQQLNVTQSEIELIGVIGGMSSYLSPLSGVIVYALPEWLVSVLVMITTLLGYVLMSLAVKAESGSALYALRNPTALGSLFCLQNFGAFILYQVLLVVNVHNMPKHRRGSAVAVLAAVVGVSASLFTFLYNSALDSNVSDMLLLMGVCILVVSFLSAIVVRQIDPVEAWGLEEAGVPETAANVLPTQPEMSSMSSSFVIPPGAGGFGGDRDDETSYLRMGHLDDELMHGSPSSASSPSSLNGSSGHVRPGVMSLSSTDVYALDTELRFESEHERLLFEQGRMERAQMEVQSRVCGGGLSGQVFGAIWFLVHKIQFWVMLFCFILVAGAGLMQINNTGHIVQSLNGGVQDRDLTAMLILMLSLANGAGRLLMGLSDIVPIRKGWWLVGVCALMTLMHLANAYILDKKELIILGVVGVGLAYGGLWAILPILIGEIFGPKNFSMNLGWVSFSAGLGGLFCNHFTGVFYDRATPAGEIECAGTECYRWGFVLCACSAAVAMFVSLPLLKYTQCGRVPGARK